MRQEATIINTLYKILTGYQKEIDKMLKQDHEIFHDMSFMIPNNTIVLLPIDIKTYHEKIGLDNVLIRRLKEVTTNANDIEEIRDLYNNLLEIQRKFTKTMDLELASLLLPKLRVRDDDDFYDILKEYVRENSVQRYIQIPGEFKKVKEIIEYFRLDQYYTVAFTKFRDDLVPDHSKVLKMLEKLNDVRKEIYKNFSKDIVAYRAINPDYCELIEKIFGEQRDSLYGKEIVDVVESVFELSYGYVCHTTPRQYFCDWLENFKEIAEYIKETEENNITTNRTVDM